MRKIKLMSVAASALLSGAVFLSACSGPAQTDPSPGGTDAPGETGDSLDVAFLLYGDLEDRGWHSSLNVMFQEIKETFGDKINVTYKENVPESPESLQVIDNLIDDGYDYIVGTSYGFSQYLSTKAGEYPDVRFAGYECTETADNLSCFEPNFPAGFYIAGMLAGIKSESGVMGITAGMPVPNNISAINQWALGARSVNPSAEVRVVYINSWFDPAKSQQAAEGLLASGADVLGTMLNSPETGQVAERADASFIGRDFIGQKEYAPEGWLTGVILNWTPYFTEQISALLDGKWSSSKTLIPFADCCVVAEFGPAADSLSGDEIAAVEQRLQELKDGTFDPYEGPIKDTSGEVRIPEGSTITEEQRSGLDWYVEGVIASE